MNRNMMHEAANPGVNPPLPGTVAEHSTERTASR
jgi:hypothetical protein